MFTQKHYGALADWWLDQFTKYGYTSQLCISYSHFKLMLARDNSTFKEPLFDKASGYLERAA